MKSFLIIGMGTFGHHLCEALCRNKCEIMIVDQNSEAVEDMLPYVTEAKVADCTNIEVLKSFDVGSFDACFVCVNQAFQACLEITDQLKELGAKRVYSKADRDLEAKFLRRCGADYIIYPERDAAERIAVRESSEHIFDFIALAEGCAICEIEPPRSGWAAPWPRWACATATTSTSSPRAPTTRRCAPSSTRATSSTRPSTSSSSAAWTTCAG